MVPVDIEAEEIQVELVRLGDVENTQHRNEPVENDLHANASDDLVRSSVARKCGS